MWLLVDVVNGLMDGYYNEETHTMEDCLEICETLNTRHFSSVFIPAKVTKGYPIGDSCWHVNSTGKRQAEAQAEQALLGAVLMNPRICSAFYIHRDHFWDRRFRTVFAAVMDIWEPGLEAIDVKKLIDRLKTKNDYGKAGGKKTIAEAVKGVPNVNHAKHYFDIVEAARLKRQEESPIAMAMEWSLFGDDGIADRLHRIEGKLDRLLPSPVFDENGLLEIDGTTKPLA